METEIRLAQDFSRQIAALQAENTRLREKLKPFANYALVTDEYTSGHTAPDEGEVLQATSPALTATVTIGDFRQARAALGHADGQ